MTTKMLINAQRAGHLRVAIVEGTQLEDFQVEITEAGLTRGNIYRGVVANVQPSLGAAFVDIGEDRHAFLPVADVLPGAYHKKPPEDERRPRVEQVLERGKPVFVQVTKDGVGQKGAALTTNIALAGRYLVLAPFDDVRGISRKAEADAARKKARERLARLNAPEGCGVIVRTNGLDQTQATLNRDLNALLRLWKRVRGEGGKGKGPRLLYSDQDLVVQALRDYLDPSIAQVIVDSDEVYDTAESYMKAFMPRSKTRLIRYRERQPLFSRYNIEAQIDAIYDRRAPLPSGGSIVIDSTEALTAIDVNSGRATQTADYEEAIFGVNVEAATEVARQLRLRDIGGIVVVDFIDMRVRKNQRKLEKAMRDALKADRARTAVGRISDNGLLEINRQRIKQSLRHRTHRPCPTCQGVGSIPSADFAALNLLGRLEARASTGLIQAVTVTLHPEIADALQNRHRRDLTELEQEFDLQIEIVSNPNYALSEDRLDWSHREAAERPAPKAQAALSAKDLSAGDRRRKAAASEPEEAAEAAEERPRRKRRRRRSGAAKKAAEKAEKAAKPAKAKPTKKAGSRKKAAAAAKEEKEAATEAPKTRRRRRPSRKPRKAQEEAPEKAAAGDDAKAERAAPEKGDEAPKAKRRRRSPRRRKPSAKPAKPAAAAGGPQGGEAADDKTRAPQRRGAPQRRDEPRPAKPPPPSSGDAARKASSLAAAPPSLAAGERSDKLSSRPLSRWLWWRRPEDGQPDDGH